jgi:ABC-type multidrug transport system ATPase subunit
VEIRAAALSKRFGAVHALRDLHFEVPAGRRVALIGPNGSGKSTLNRALMGLLACEGELWVGGCSPLRERSRIAPRMAYVPQLAPQLSVPVGELLRAVLRLRSLTREGVEKSASELGLDLAAMERLPFRSLSGGTRQKLLIALALAPPATLLILDEPTGSLDPQARERFFSLFERVPKHTTLLLCSHRLEELRQLVDHVLLLDEGRLRYDGPAARFLAASTTSLVEVCVEGPEAAGWLASEGFKPGTGHWWVRHVTPDEKRRLLAELPARLGSRLRDLNVRDLESLELGEDA